MKFEEKKKKLVVFNRITYAISFIGLFTSIYLLYCPYSLKIRLFLLIVTIIFRSVLLVQSKSIKYQLETTPLNQKQDTYFLIFAVLFFISPSYPFSYILYNIIIYLEYIVFGLEETPESKNLTLISKLNSIFTTFYLSYLIHFIHFILAIELAKKCYTEVNIINWISCYFYIFWFMVYSISTNSFIILANKLTIELNHVTQTAIVVRSPNVQGDIIIPKYINFLNIQFPVTTIKNNAFISNPNFPLNSIEFEANSKITRIEPRAFQNSRPIRKITLPESVAEIEGFFYSENYVPIDEIILLPQNKFLEYKDDILLKKEPGGCSTLIYVNKHRSNIKIPFNVRVIGQGAFSHCSKLKQVSFECNPQTNHCELTEIHEGSFFNCSSLKSITIPNSVTVIGEKAFSMCISLQEINLSNNIKIISDDSFSHTSITTIQIPSSVKIIGKCAFFHCLSLKEIKLNNNLEIIDDNAFSQTLLTSIQIPSTVKIIGKHVFDKCDHLHEINFHPKTKIKIIHESAFSNTFINTILNLKHHHFKYVNDTLLINRKHNANVILFANNDIQHITIPSYVKIIGHSAFRRCQSLKYVHFEMNENGETSLEEIHDYAFYECKSLLTISIPSSVRIIGRYSFSNCTNLQKFKIRTDWNGQCRLKQIDIGSLGFTKIQSLIIPESVVCTQGNNSYSENQINALEMQSNKEIERTLFLRNFEVVSIPNATKVHFSQIQSIKALFVNCDAQIV